MATQTVCAYGDEDLRWPNHHKKVYYHAGKAAGWRMSDVLATYGHRYMVCSEKVMPARQVS